MTKRNRIRFRDLTDKQIAILANGCGGKGGWFNPPEFLFNASCNHHDIQYILGYNRRHRLKADWQFFKMMCKDCGRRVWLYPIAALYFLAVRCVGWKFYRFGKRELGWRDIQRRIESSESAVEKSDNTGGE